MKESQVWLGAYLYAFGALIVSAVGIVQGAVELGDSLLAKWALVAGIANVCQLCLVGNLVITYWQSGCGFFANVATVICLILSVSGVNFLANVILGDDSAASSALFGVSVCLDIVCFLSALVMYSGWSYVQRE